MASRTWWVERIELATLIAGALSIGYAYNRIDQLEKAVAKLEAPDPRKAECARLAQQATQQDGTGYESSIKTKAEQVMTTLGCHSLD